MTAKTCVHTISRVAVSLAVLLIIASVGSACNAKVNEGSGNTAASTAPAIMFMTNPTPAKAGDNQLEVMLNGADGKPIDDADVSVLCVMPAMPAMNMSEMRNEVRLKPAGAGKYTGTAQLMMAGDWNVTVSVKQSGKEIGQKAVTLTTK